MSDQAPFGIWIMPRKKSVGVNTLITMQHIKLDDLSDEDKKIDVSSSTADAAGSTSDFEFPNIEGLSEPPTYAEKNSDTRDEEEEMDARLKANEFRDVFYSGLADFRDSAIRDCADYYGIGSEYPSVPDDLSPSSSSTLVGASQRSSSSSSEELLMDGSVSGTDSGSSSSPDDGPTSEQSGHDMRDGASDTGSKSDKVSAAGVVPTFTNERELPPSYLAQCIAGIPSFNFTEVDMRPNAFPRFDRQYNDARYLYLEELASRSLNKHPDYSEEAEKESKKK
ncbi:uncharacterized protein LOC119689752 isoform X2 [Teleopsis dalmanni]|uniref:uncharacterized protein LOC119689752 isoform X2 n=1 Tax=Teleopsis dalmanni TaxID=139649 RepID=UPI0018CE0A73|nr:uncharacterized protein LOC119689752 isoform X2 [Teleopsis dalmanni]